MRLFKAKQQMKLLWLFFFVCVYSCDKEKELKSHTYIRYTCEEEGDMSLSYSVGHYRSGSIKYYIDLMSHLNDTIWYEDSGKRYTEKKENKEFHYSNKYKEVLNNVVVYVNDTIYYYSDEQLKELDSYFIKKDNSLIEECTYGIIPQKRMFTDIKTNKYGDVISQIVYSETYYEDGTVKETYLEEHVYEYY